jgi:hypothetical protein
MKQSYKFKNSNMLKFLKHPSFANQPETTYIDKLSSFGAIGQKVIFSFSLFSTEEIQEIELSVTPLTNKTSALNLEQIEIYIVKRWDVSGVGIYQSNRITAAELLLKDDRITLKDGYTEHPHNGIGSENPMWLYVPPDVRTTGNANTFLYANEHKQILLSIKIPSYTRPNNFLGFIKIVTSIGETYELPIELKVLPFTLAQPHQDLLIWYRGSMDPRQSQFHVSPSLFQLHLQDIYDHGFRSISICETDRSIAQAAIDIAEQVGFDRHIVFRNILYNAQALNFKKLKPIFLLSDEIDNQTYSPDITCESRISQHKDHGKYCQFLNWDSMSSLVNQKFISRFANEQDIGYMPTIISLSLSENKAHFANEQKPLNPKIYYHWQSHMEKPNLHRVLSGIYLWKTKASGIAPYCYQHVPIFPFSPFNDFDAWEPSSRVGKFRDCMTTYPAQSGIIPTLQWEGLGEGITDLSYLTTLDLCLAHLEKLSLDTSKTLSYEIRQRRDAFIDRIDIESIDINNETTMEPYTNISPSAYEEFRKQIALDIGVLLQMMYPSGETMYPSGEL